MSSAEARGPSALATWISSVATLILATVAIERACPEAPYGFRAAIWGLLLAVPTAHVLASRYGGNGSGREVEGSGAVPRRAPEPVRSARGRELREGAPMRRGASEGRTLLAVWVAAAGSVMVAAALTEWLCPEAPYGYQMALWLLFLVTPLVYTILAWYEGPGADGGATGGGS